jgi:uncharacterized membrane protein
MNILGALFLAVIPFIVVYFLIYFAVKNAIVDAKRELASSQSSTFNALND